MNVWATALAVALVIVALDQMAKSWAVAHVSDKPIHVVGSLQFLLTYNPGIAFGLGSGVAPVLVGIAIAGVLAVLVAKQSSLSKPTVFAIGLVLGGAIGNVCDRLFRSHGGAVVDFIDLQWWPVFNVADASVVIGAVTLAVLGSRRKEIESVDND